MLLRFLVIIFTANDIVADFVYHMSSSILWFRSASSTIFSLKMRIQLVLAD
jgi:hypothetical protein